MSVHSTDGKAWLTKLERIGDLSARDRGMVFNNVGHLVTVDMLRDLYQRLDGTKAVGVDGVSKEAYGVDLESKLESLVRRIRKGQYRPMPAKIVEIPKEDGSSRPLAISCVEDKLVQSAANAVLTAIYEPLFLPCSYGFRPKRSCHDALRDMIQATYEFHDGAVVEIDLRSYFNSIPHGPLGEMLRRKISDPRFLRLLDVLIKAPYLQDGAPVANDRGSPQGSILSPTLANIYLHHVIDEWFQSISATHLQGRVREIRYADDVVFAFEKSDQAQKFFDVLPKRLAKYGIEMHDGKSRLLPCGSKAAAKMHSAGFRMPTFKFLGFSCYWGKTRKGFWRLMLKSRSDRMRAKLKGLWAYLRKHLGTNNRELLIKRVIAVVRGWVNYHAVSDNTSRVKAFIRASKRILLHWFNRRGARKKMYWKRLERFLEQKGYPKCQIKHSMFQSPKWA